MPRRFGEKLRHLRQLRNITQMELARQLSLSSSTHITKIEAGQREASLDLIVRAAVMFGVTTDYLLRDTTPVTMVADIGRPSHGNDRPDPTYKVELPAVAPPVPDELWRRFGAQLRGLRQRQRWSQADLARHLGLASRAYISNLEAGRKGASPELVVQIADLFGVKTDYLLLDTRPAQRGAASVEGESE